MKIEYRESNGRCCGPMVAGLPWRGKIVQYTPEDVPLSGEMFIPGGGGFHYCPDCLPGKIKGYTGELAELAKILTARCAAYHADLAERVSFMGGLRNQLPEPFASFHGCEFWVHVGGREYRLLTQQDLALAPISCVFGHDMEYTKAAVEVSDDAMVLSCIDTRRPSLYDRMVQRQKK